MSRNSRLIACSVLLAAPLAAQANEARVSHGAYARSHDYDLVHQRIELSDFNWDSTGFTGQVATVLVALRPGLDSIILDAGKLLTIQRVTGARGASLRFATHGDTLVVFPATPLAFAIAARSTTAPGWRTAVDSRSSRARDSRIARSRSGARAKT